jgi:prolyl-tRNA synthetase
MRASQLYAPTLRESPAEAEIISHKLMFRAGMIRKAAGGVYTYLPLALRVLKKIEAIIRQEMDAAGGQELLMPIIQPAEIWQQSGRWDVYGDEMFRLKDRHNRSFCLGPTHEEMITTLIRSEVRSYRQLPLLLYQIQNKYRDERRPRFGLMRGREFIMKDLYSFDRDEAGLQVSYQKMYDAYRNIFSRCGLTFRPVEADSGQIGGSGSHEFMALAESGEAAVAFCTGCDYAANVEKAELSALANENLDEPALLETVATPGIKTIDEVCNFLQVVPAKTIKALVYQTEKDLVVALVRGDHTVNEVKLQNVLGCLELQLADDQAIEGQLSSAVGFIGPVGLNSVIVVSDLTVMNMVNAVCGANSKDTHYRNVNPGRDFAPKFIKDIRLIAENDPCPRCGAPVKTARGIEVGQVFKLYTKYSESLGASYLDENGKDKPFYMGCYGIGVSRTLASAIEQHNDEQGIIWPVAIAPYHVVVIPINAKDSDQLALATTVYNTLNQAGIETVLDDRRERAGAKFKDADLIGYPLRITVGPKAISEQQLEVKDRQTGEQFLFPVADYVMAIQKLLKQQ